MTDPRTGPARVRTTRDAVVMAFPAEVDLDNADALRAQAVGLLDGGAPALVLDLTACEFCASAGISVIARAHIRARVLGTPLAVWLPEDGTVRRICEMTGIVDTVEIATPGAGD
ncbi:STAS domain-containing protein [Actinomadura parmotrematis]|uniref:STAS domain-containing protein n=1 Tax=Actinomadura parmotrematis TaxID=2864039 RepID=A0ABS7FYH5_9ACTN|nr:STAS domain-containing protein [Actinomadura parmotrematis]MBW8485321.1 STAS domain-containing protein [Actinomadura parmotrematis]